MLKADLLAVRRLTKVWKFTVLLNLHCLLLCNGKDKDLAVELAEWRLESLEVLLDLFRCLSFYYHRSNWWAAQVQSLIKNQDRGKWRKESGKSDSFGVRGWIKCLDLIAFDGDGPTSLSSGRAKREAGWQEEDETIIYLIAVLQAIYYYQRKTMKIK